MEGFMQRKETGEMPRQDSQRPAMWNSSWRIINLKHTVIQPVACWPAANHTQGPNFYQILFLCFRQSTFQRGACWEIPIHSHLWRWPEGSCGPGLYFWQILRLLEGWLWWKRKCHHITWKSYSSQQQHSWRYVKCTGIFYQFKSQGGWSFSLPTPF